MTAQAFQRGLEFTEQRTLTFGKDSPELVEQPAQGIALHVAHLHEQLALPVQREGGLLLSCFHAHELDLGLLHGQPDRTRVRGISLVACHKGTHDLGVQQAHGVAQRGELARPVMRSAARLHGDEASRLAGKVLKHFGTLELHVDDLAGAHVHRVQLKHLLGDVQPHDLLAVHGADELSCTHAWITIHDGSSTVFVKTTVYHALGALMPYPSEDPSPLFLIDGCFSLSAPTHSLSGGRHP